MSGRYKRFTDRTRPRHAQSCGVHPNVNLQLIYTGAGLRRACDEFLKSRGLDDYRAIARLENLSDE